MTWTGNEHKTQSLWAILPCHTLSGETADVYETVMLTERPLNVVYFTVQIQKHTFEKLSNLATKTTPQVQLWAHAQNSSRPMRRRMSPCQTNQLRRRRAAQAVARVCPWWLLPRQANQIAPYRSQPVNRSRPTQRARPPAFLIGRRSDHSLPWVLVRCCWYWL